MKKKQKKCQRDGSAFLLGCAERVVFVHPGEEKAPQNSYCGLSVLEMADKKDGYRFFSKASCNWTRLNSLKIKEGSFRLDTRRKIIAVGVAKPLVQVVWRDGRCPFREALKVSLDRALSDLM